MSDRESASRSGVRRVAAETPIARERVDSAEVAAAVRRLLWPAAKRAVSVVLSFGAGAGVGAGLSSTPTTSPATSPATPATGQAVLECRLLLEWADVFADELHVPAERRPRPGPPPMP